MRKPKVVVAWVVWDKRENIPAVSYKTRRGARTGCMVLCLEPGRFVVVRCQGEMTQ